MSVVDTDVAAVLSVVVALRKIYGHGPSSHGDIARCLSAATTVIEHLDDDASLHVTAAAAREVPETTALVRRCEAEVARVARQYPQWDGTGEAEAHQAPTGWRPGQHPQKRK